MKRLGFLFLFIAVIVNCLRSQIPTDKILHFGAGYLISFCTYEIFEDNKKAFNISFTTGAAAGGAKEFIDYLGHGNATPADLKATSMGALFGTVSFKVILNLKQKKKGNLEAWQGTDAERKAVYIFDSTEIAKHKFYRLSRDSI